MRYPLNKYLVLLCTFASSLGLASASTSTGAHYRGNTQTVVICSVHGSRRHCSRSMSATPYTYTVDYPTATACVTMHSGQASCFSETLLYVPLHVVLVIDHCSPSTGASSFSFRHSPSSQASDPCPLLPSPADGLILRPRPFSYWTLQLLNPTS